MSRTTYSHYERDQTYRSIERVLDWFRHHDHELARQTALCLPDGYPQGGDGGGRSGGDHSDPTLAAVATRVDGTDDASRAFRKLQEALIVFGEAHVLGRRALPVLAVDGAKKAALSVDDLWCVSCARVRDAQGHQAIFVRRTLRKGGRKDLCDWCQGEWLGTGKERRLPDQRLVMAHYRDVRLTDAKRSEVLSMKVVDARALYIDGAEGRASSAPESRAG